MTLVRTAPSRSLSPVQSDFNRLFSSLFDTPTAAGATFARSGRGFSPALDIVEHDEDFTLSVDLPGLSESDVKVEILDGRLTISGERTNTAQASENGYSRIERTFGSFERTLALPKGVEPSTVSASFKHGVLEVTVPKPAEAKPQQVEIAVQSAA